MTSREACVAVELPRNTCTLVSLAPTEQSTLPRMQGAAVADLRRIFGVCVLLR